MNRREFCFSAAAAATVAACSSQADDGRWWRGHAAATLVRPYKLLFDNRFAAARLLGAEAARRGLAATAFDGDVTPLWLHDLGPRWAADRAPVAGITTPQALFCLEQLARDAWMRVTVRAEHASGDAQRCRHRVSGQAASVPRICAALDAAADWPARMAAALVALPHDGSPLRQRRQVGAGGWRGDGHAAELVSWMISA